MRFISVRDLRGKPGEIWRALEREREMILTSNGKPLAILARVGEEDWERTLAAFRRARALAAVEALQRGSAGRGLDRMSPEEVDGLIARVRKERRSK